MPARTDQEIQRLKEDGKLLKSEKGNRFYHRALSPKARARKKARRKQARKSRKGR